MAAPRSPLTGLVLAGGQSRRMGTDKAVLRWRGERLVDRATRVLGEVCDEVLVASGTGRRLHPHGAVEIPDAMPRAGPLGGLVAGLERARHPLVAVLAVDLPSASATVLRALADAWDGQAAVVPLAGGRAQPLHAVWSAAAAPALRARLTVGQRGVNAAAEALGALMVGPEVWGTADTTGRFADNLNTPADRA